MFSPSVWLNEAQANANNDTNGSGASVGGAQKISSQSDFTIREGNGNGNGSQQQQPAFNTPSNNPFAEFRELQKNQNEAPGTDSPNVALAKFFARKGNEPLSAIEIEGVKALLSKSNNNTANSSMNLSRTEDEDEDDDDTENDEIHNNVSINDSLLQHDPSRFSSSATPTFKATYNNNSNIRSRSNTPESSSRQVRKKTYDFSGFPSPYRTSRLKSSFSVSDLKQNNNNNRNNTRTILKQKSTEPAETKKLSDSASTLLSFIENSKTDETAKKTADTITNANKFVDFSNPYAINRKVKKKNAPVVVKATEPSMVERLEKSLDEDEDEEVEDNKEEEEVIASQAQAQLQSKQHHGLGTLNKYKPTKSSSLRASITVDNDEDISMDNEDNGDDNNNAKEAQTTFQGAKKVATTAASSTTFAQSPIIASTPASTNGSKPFSFAASSTVQRKEQQQQLPAQESTAITTPLFGNSSNSHSLFSLRPTSQAVGQQEQLEEHKESEAPLFSFPNAISSGYSASDVDENKVRLYRSLFTF